MSVVGLSNDRPPGAPISAFPHGQDRANHERRLHEDPGRGARPAPFSRTVSPATLRPPLTASRSMSERNGRASRSPPGTACRSSGTRMSVPTRRLTADPEALRPGIGTRRAILPLPGTAAQQCACVRSSSRPSHPTPTQTSGSLSIRPKGLSGQALRHDKPLISCLVGQGRWLQLPLGSNSSRVLALPN